MLVWDSSKGKSTGSDHPLAYKRYYNLVWVPMRPPYRNIFVVISTLPSSSVYLFWSFGLIGFRLLLFIPSSPFALNCEQLLLCLFRTNLLSFGLSIILCGSFLLLYLFSFVICYSVATVLLIIHIMCVLFFMHYNILESVDSCC
jgi:hypothetical protein